MFTALWHERLQPLLCNNRLRHLPTFVSACLVVALLYSFSGLIEILRPQPRDDVPARQTEDARGASQHSNETPPPPGGLARWHLFGQVQIVREVPPVPISAPDTKLNLKLHGVIASDRKDSAGAIIEDGAGSQQYYAIGEQLPHGAELKEVHPDRVILLRNSQYETLRMPATTLPPGEITPANSTAAMGNMGNAAAPESDVGARLQQHREALLKRNASQKKDKLF